MNTCIYNSIRSAQDKGSLMLAALALLASTGFQATLAQTYTITDLGDLGGGQSQASSINNRGQVVGFASASPQKKERAQMCDCDEGGICSCWNFTYYYYESHAFLWTPATPNGIIGAMSDLGAVGGGNYSWAFSVNANGQAVGVSESLNSYYYGTRARPARSFLYSGGRMIDLGPAFAWGINSVGQIVGVSGGRAVISQNGTMTDLGKLPGADFANPWRINDWGQVAGSCGYYTEPGAVSFRAFLWTPSTPNGTNGSMVDLGAGQAVDINAWGQIVGAWGQVPGGVDGHGFLWTPFTPNGTNGTRTDLGLNDAWAINSVGQILGRIGDRPVLLQNGVVSDVNSLIPSNSGWVLRDVVAFNDKAQIVGMGTNPSGQQHAYLLTPVSRPRLISSARQTGGQFRFTLVGETGRSYTIQASTNLVTWTAVTNFISVTGTNQFTDPAAPNFSRRFYRAVTP